MSEGDLTIRAHRRQPDGRPDREGFQSEFVYGAFARSLTIPSDVCAGAVRAAYHDGILEIRIDLDDSEASVRVPVDRT